ncbi:MAG: hypothetical protein RR145_03710 [Oscillospiraceae bacterium]
MDIEQMAAQPKMIDIDGQKVENHNVKDLIEVDRYLEAKKAAKKCGRGLRFSKLEAPGA